MNRTFSKHRRLPAAILSSLLLTVALSACVGSPDIPQADLGQTDPKQLPGTSWVAERILGKPAAIARSALEFRDAAQVGGNTGCNAFSGGVTLSETTMQFSPLAATRRMCAPAISGQETAFLEALELTRSWQKSGGVLELLDSDSNVVMILIKI